MERLPADIKVQVLQKATSHTEKNRGLSLRVPGKLVESIRDELLQLINDPKDTSALKVLLDEFGFLVLNLTLTAEERQQIPNLEVLGAGKNYFPLLWHKDGGTRNLAQFGALFSDTRGPRRLSRTAIAEVEEIFPSLLASADKLIIDLMCEGAPDNLVNGWKKVKRILIMLLTPEAVEKKIRTSMINLVLNQYLDMLDFAFTFGYVDYTNYDRIIAESITGAKKIRMPYIHEWKLPQTLLISSQKDFIHCRVPERRKRGVVGGRLFAKAVTKD